MSFGTNYKFCPYCGETLTIKIEEGNERKYCKLCNWTYYPTESIAPAAIMEIDNKVLLVQRNREPHKGKWQFPSGFKNYGEMTLETLAREIMEELDVKLTAHKFIREFKSYEDPRNIGTLVPFYKVEWVGEPKNNEPDENIAIGWFDLKNLPQIAWVAHGQILQELRDCI